MGAGISRRIRSDDREGNVALLDRAEAGEPGWENWQGKAINHPGATAWMTGAYDAQLDTL